MHIMFSENEKLWIDTQKFGFKIKNGCPKNIRKMILKKLEIINKQFLKGENSKKIGEVITMGDEVTKK